MDLELVAAEIDTALAGITGLRLPPWGVEDVAPPARILALPEKISYQESYGPTVHRVEDWPLVILVGAPEERASRKLLAAYAHGSGAKSVFRVLEAYGVTPGWTRCDSVTVVSCDFSADALYADVPLLAAVFHLDIIGKAT